FRNTLSIWTRPNSACRRANVASVEPSSTTTTSNSGYLRLSSPRVLPTIRSSMLHTGTTTLIGGANGVGKDAAKPATESRRGEPGQRLPGVRRAQAGPGGGPGQLGHARVAHGRQRPGRVVRHPVVRVVQARGECGHGARVTDPAERAGRRRPQPRVFARPQAR